MLLCTLIHTERYEERVSKARQSCVFLFTALQLTRSHVVVVAATLLPIDELLCRHLLLFFSFPIYMLAFFSSSSSFNTYEYDNHPCFGDEINGDSSLIETIYWWISLIRQRRAHAMALMGMSGMLSHGVYSVVFFFFNFFGSTNDKEWI